MTDFILPEFKVAIEESRKLEFKPSDDELLAVSIILISEVNPSKVV